MAKIRKVDYFVMRAKDRPGEGARMLKALKKHEVDLLAFSAFPDGAGTQVDFVPSSSRRFLDAAKALDWEVSPRKAGFMVQGKDRTGALSGLMGRLGKAGINVTAIDGVSAGKKRFGAIFWVAAVDVVKAARLLKAK
jgi:prephenate dehydratase